MKGEFKKPSENIAGAAIASDKLTNGFVLDENSKEGDQITLEDIREQIRYIEKAVSSQELYYMARVVRSLSSIRRKLNYNVLRGLVQAYFPNSCPQKTYFMEFLPEVSRSNLLFFRLWIPIVLFHRFLCVSQNLLYCRWKLKYIYICC